MKFEMVTVSTQTDVYENVHCQAQKELDVMKPTQVDEGELESVLDVDYQIPNGLTLLAQVSCHTGHKCVQEVGVL